MIVLITFELVYLKNNLKIDTDLKALFKGHNPTVLELQDMEERVGTYSTVLVVANSPDREKNIEALLRIKNKIIDDPAVRFIEFDRDIDYIEKHALLFASVEELEKIRNEVRNAIADKVAESMSLTDNNDTSEKSAGTLSLAERLDEIEKKARIYRDKYNISRFYEAENGTFVAMKVRPGGSETNVSDTKTIVDLLDRAILETRPEELGVKVEAGGHFRNKLKEMNSIYNDIFSTLAICVFLLCLTIIFYFRSL
jgi:predicted RND superfamily exporter protein